MKVQVTQDDIDSGFAGSLLSCPIAIAMNREIPRDARWQVGCVWASADELYVTLPALARHWIRRFDAGLDVKPTTFNVDLESAS